MRHIREQIERGDQSGFAALVREHQGLVFSVAYRFFGDRCQAEDVAQEVFLELYRSIDSIESDLHLLMWLRRVTSHRCIDEARRRRVRPQLSIEELPDLPTHSKDGDPMLADTLRRYVTALPEEQRAVVILRYQEDLDPTDIARELGMPVNTVKSYLHRALGVLREKVTRRVQGVRV
jgi:RNA polymerase sigma-70 factor (ECF subfamily)